MTNIRKKRRHSLNLHSYFVATIVLVATMVPVTTYAQREFKPEVVPSSYVFFPLEKQKFVVEATTDDVWHPVLELVREAGLEITELSTRSSKFVAEGVFEDISASTISLNTKNMTASPFAGNWGECVQPDDSKPIGDKISLSIQFDEWTHRELTRVQSKISTKLIRTIDTEESTKKIECITSGKLESSIYEYITGNFPLLDEE